jgi:hypothetical protein
MLSTIQRRIFLSSFLLSKNIKIRIYKTTVLHVVLCGCDAWSLTSEEEHKFTVFGNRVLRRIFGPKRESGGRLEKTAQ